MLQACTGEIGEAPTNVPPLQAPADCRLDAENTLGRRLTRNEYVNTLSDVLEVDVQDDIGVLPPDPRAEGFTNTADALVVSYQHIEGYAALADVVVSKISWPAFVDEYAACTDFTAACQDGFINNIGLRLFRRPLTEVERENIRFLFDKADEEGDDFSVGAQLVVKAMLQSPQFLYRLEAQRVNAKPGSGYQVRSLDSYEIATRLSYLLWGSAPDEALLDVAAAGKLNEPDVIAAEVARMLKKPQARTWARRYFRDWLALDALDTLSRDPMLYPEWDAELAADMKEETLRLFDELVWEDPTNMSAMLTSEFTFASDRLAELYGLSGGEPSDEPGLKRYTLDGVERMGVLTQASFQAVNGIGNRPSMVQRGVFMLYNMLCGSVAAPPAGVDTSMSQAEEDQSQRYYSELRMDNTVCKGCHYQFDPLAYGFERYDGIGRYVTEDEFGNPLMQDGWFIEPGSSEQQPYADVAEFAGILAASPAVQRCLVEKPMQFAIGRPLEKSDTCGLDRVESATRDGGGRYQSMMLAIASDPNFVVIAADDEGGTP